MQIYCYHLINNACFPTDKIIGRSRIVKALIWLWNHISEVTKFTLVLLFIQPNQNTIFSSIFFLEVTVAEIFCNLQLQNLGMIVYHLVGTRLECGGWAHGVTHISYITNFSDMRIKIDNKTLDSIYAHFKVYHFPSQYQVLVIFLLKWPKSWNLEW